jgi:hypothetical protein
MVGPNWNVRIAGTKIPISVSNSHASPTRAFVVLRFTVRPHANMAFISVPHHVLFAAERGDLGDDYAVVVEASEDGWYEMVRGMN